MRMTFEQSWQKSLSVQSFRSLMFIYIYMATYCYGFFGRDCNLRNFICSIPHNGGWIRTDFTKWTGF